MEKKVFLDTNILIDYLATRRDYLAASSIDDGQGGEFPSACVLAAIREGADAIITRNSSDFDAAQIEVYEPQQFLDMLTQK